MLKKINELIRQCQSTTLMVSESPKALEEIYRYAGQEELTRNTDWPTGLKEIHYIFFGAENTIK